MATREIKFRALFFPDNEWCYFTLKQLGILGTAYINYKHWSQYTGLKDKNGKEIYEGDILETKDEDGGLAVVDWEKGCFYSSSITEGMDTYKLGQNHLDFEVIGNIYENKDLL